MGKLQKAFFLMMCATVPGEALAARDAVLRIAGCTPYEFTRAITTSRMPPRDMARRVWRDAPHLSEDDQDFLLATMDGETLSARDYARLEKLYAKCV